MNAESSRSHSIFSVLVEVLNKTTGKATAGKLSLVDLAGEHNRRSSCATCLRWRPYFAHCDRGSGADAERQPWQGIVPIEAVA